MTGRSVQSAVILCRKAFEEAKAAAQEAGEHELTAKEVGTHAALANLPLLDSKQGVFEYVACIAWMQSRSLLEPAEIKAHHYTAQMALNTLNSMASAIAKPNARKVVKVASVKRKSKTV